MRKTLELFRSNYILKPSRLSVADPLIEETTGKRIVRNVISVNVSTGFEKSNLHSISES